MNIGVHVSLSILVSLVCMSSSGIAGSKGSSWTEVRDIVQENKNEMDSRLLDGHNISKNSEEQH